MLVDVVQPDRPPSRDDRRAVSQDAIALGEPCRARGNHFFEGAKLNALAIASPGISWISAVGADQRLDALAIPMYTVAGAMGAGHWLSELVVF
jgi:hypothetical protein